MLVLITGPMFAGKTTTLHAIVEYLRKDNPNLSVKFFTLDTRHKGKSITHDASEIGIPIHYLPYTEEEFISETKDVDLILIDDAQFAGMPYPQYKEFRPWLPKVCHDLVGDNLDRVVVVGSLDLTHDGVPWEIAAKFACYADDVRKLTATCEYCGAQSTRTRLREFREDRGIIGGKELYHVPCEECYIELFGK